MSEALYYTLEIKWSDEHQCYVVLAPEWEHYFGPIAEGATYEEAAARGRNALEDMIEFSHERGEPLPQPQTFVGAQALPDSIFRLADHEETLPYAALYAALCGGSVGKLAATAVLYSIT